MQTFIRFALTNFTLTLLLTGLAVSAIALWCHREPPTREVVIETVLSYFVLFTIGVSYLYNFVMHTVFGEMTARIIGWADSPFQTEVGFASLGFAAIGFLAWRGSYDLRLAAILGTAFFSLGAAGVHIYEMVTAHNFATGNAGVVFYTDILLPLIGFALLYLSQARA